MKRTSHSIAAACLAAAVSSAPLAAWAQPAPIKIGFVAELSGPFAYMGEDQYDAFMMVVEANGGKLGGVPVEVLREDSKLRPEVALQVVTKLMEKDKVSVITGFTFSNIVLAVQKQVVDRQVFLVGSLGAPAPLAGKACSAFQFFVSPQADSVAQAYSKFAIDRGYKRVMLLAPNIQGGKDYINGFKRFYTGTVVDEVLTTMNQPDYAAEVAQVAAAKPDAVMAFFPGAMGVTFIRQYQQAGLTKQIPLMTAAVLDGPSLKALKDNALGVYNAHAWSPDIPTPANRKFVGDFEKRTGRAATQPAAYGYESALLLDGAIRKVKGNVQDKPAFMAALKSAPFNSIRGDFAFGNNNFPITDLYVSEVIADAAAGTRLKTVATPLRKHQDNYHQECDLK